MKSYIFFIARFSVILPFFGVSLCWNEIILSQEIPQKENAINELKAYIEDLFQKGLAHREQITSGQMTITSHTRTWGSLPGEVTRETTIAFDKNRRRVDRHNIFANNNSYDEIACIGCYEKDNRLLFNYDNSQRRKEENLQKSIMFFDEKQLEENEKTKFWNIHFNFMPQYIGYFAENSFPRRDTLESAKGRLLASTIGVMNVFDPAQQRLPVNVPVKPEFSVSWSGINENFSSVAELSVLIAGDYVSPTKFSVTITKEEYKGTLCKKITFETIHYNYSDNSIHSTSLNTLWIAEGQGYALRKHHYQGTLYDTLLEVDVALDRDSDIWFPSAWQYERKDDGKLTTQAKVTIKNVVLNKPLPENLFDMKDIKIFPLGTRVAWVAELVPPPYEGELLWDGTDVITRGMFAENLIAGYAAENKSKRFKMMILVNVAGISLILAFFLLRYYKHLKQQS